MRILQIASGDFFSTYGGGQVYVKNIVDEFIRQQDDVCVISNVNGIEDNKWIEKNYKEHPLFEASSLTDNTYCELVKHINPDVIHAHSNKAQVCRIGKKLGIPVVVTAHHGGILCPAGTRLNCRDEICRIQPSHRDCLKCYLRNIRTGIHWHPFMRFLPEKTYGKLGKWLQSKPFIPFITPIGGAALSIAGKQFEWQQIADLCSVMIAPCHEIGEAMVHCGLPKDKLKVIPHGIPLPQTVPPFPEIKDGAVQFFYVGRICYVKGIHILLEAFHNLKNEKVRLHLIGGAGNKQEERYQNRLKRKYRNDDRIIWHGKVNPDEVFDMIADYHVSVSPSFLESFGLNISESLAMGKPVLSTRCGGAEIQITDDINGWLVEPNNPKALQSKMEEICNTFTSFKIQNAFDSVTKISEHVAELRSVYNDLSVNGK